MDKKIEKTDEEWKKILTPEQFRVLREKGTEAPYSGEYFETTEPGTYICAACGNELFDSTTKYDALCGWPSFTAPKKEDGVQYAADSSHGMVRTEVTCARCGGHLGHVFDDGPGPTHKRFCMNSASLTLRKKPD